MSLFSHEFHEDSSDEFGTPAEFHRPIADAVGGFDLDPASGAESQLLASTRIENFQGLAAGLQTHRSGVHGDKMDQNLLCFAKRRDFLAVGPDEPPDPSWEAGFAESAMLALHTLRIDLGKSYRIT